MARRKSKAKQEEEFINGVMVLSLFGSLAITYTLTKSIQVSIIVCILVVAVVIAALISRKLKHEERLKRSGIAEIDKMEGVQFEQYLGHLFRSKATKLKLHKQQVITALIWSYPKTGSELLSRLSGTARMLD
ncbi:hypothetical protein [Paenibacillus sp. FSL M7-1046]|uniref:hypothetical protein n=1 Tax=Paenibacillus sp. FSL M7-1046 TaxID=2975315 RepID=UPI0030F610B6